MNEFESIQHLVQEFGEENQALIENKLGEIMYRFDRLDKQNNKAYELLEEHNKRLYAVESHPNVCALAPRISHVESAIKAYQELDIQDRLLTVEQTIFASVSIKKWLVAAIGITATLFSMGVGVLKLIGWL